MTAGLRGQDAFDDLLTFDLSYTLSLDRSDDDNERDPFTFRYADASNLAPEFGWSDRDRRHKATGYLAFSLPGDVAFSNIVRYLSASPVSESCARRGERASPAGGPDLRGRLDPRAQHAPARQRVLHLGHEAVAAVHGRPAAARSSPSSRSST